MPVILIVYDVAREVAHWLYVQQVLENRIGGRDLDHSRYINFHLSKDNVVNEQAIEQFREFKRIVLSQTEEVKHYG